MLAGTWTRTVASTVEVVSVSELATHLRLDDYASELGYLATLIESARTYLEETSRRAWITQTWQLKLDDWNGEELVLPRPPLLSVTSVQYVDTAGDTQTLAADQYTVLSSEEPARIVPAYSVSWPSLRDVPHAVTVTYTAGYGAASSSVPRPLRHAVLLLCAHLYEMREPVITGSIVARVPMSVDALVAPYRVMGF